MTIKVNYKGTFIKRDFDYKCDSCGHTCVINQRASDEMEGHKCPNCTDGILYRYITKAPSLDADFHESQRAHNLNWDGC